MGAPTLDTTFAALADPHRRAILARLAVGSATVTELAAPLPISQPAVSRHLRVLEDAGLISQGRVGNYRPRQLDAAPLQEATQWLAAFRSFWEERYAQLDELLDTLQALTSPGGEQTPP
jgi:DNA-binding transcriptional ArsR family regulator